MKKFILASFLLSAVLGGSAMAQNYPIEHFTTKNGIQVDITCIVHGTVAIDYSKDGQHYTIVADAVGNMGGEVSYSNLRKAELVLVTHEHGDHLDPKTINSINSQAAGSRIIANRKSYDSIIAAFPALEGKSSVFANGDKTAFGEKWMGECSLKAVPAYNTTEANKNLHPKGNGNGYVLTVDDFTIYIAGDTEPLVDMKSMGKVDVAFLPVNQPYTMTPKQCGEAAAMIQPKVLIPYHMSKTDFEAIVAEVKTAAPGVEIRMHEELR